MSESDTPETVPRPHSLLGLLPAVAFPMALAALFLTTPPAVMSQSWIGSNGAWFVERFVAIIALVSFAAAPLATEWRAQQVLLGWIKSGFVAVVSLFVYLHWTGSAFLATLEIDGGPAEVAILMAVTAALLGVSAGMISFIPGTLSRKLFRIENGGRGLGTYPVSTMETALVILSQAVPSAMAVNGIPFWIIPLVFGAGLLLSFQWQVVAIPRTRLSINIGGTLIPVAFSLFFLPAISPVTTLLLFILSFLVFSASFRTNREGTVAMNRFVRLLASAAVFVAVSTSTLGWSTIASGASPQVLLRAFVDTFPFVVAGIFAADIFKSIRASRRMGVGMVVGYFGLKDINWYVITEFLLIYLAAVWLLPLVL